MKECKFDLTKSPATAIGDSDRGLVKITGYDKYRNFIMNKSVSSGWDPNAGRNPSTSTSKGRGIIDSDPNKKICSVGKRKDGTGRNLDFLRQSIRKNSLGGDGEKIGNKTFLRARDMKVSNWLGGDTLNRTYDENFCRKGTRPDDKKSWIPFDSQSFNWDMFKDETKGVDFEGEGKGAGKSRANGGS